MNVVRSCALGALVLSRVAFGAEVDARATTLMLAGPELSNPATTTQTLVPLYERATLSVRKVSAPGISDGALVIDAWASYLLTGGTLGGDVNLAYAEALTADKHLRLRVGRQFVTGGTARMLALDGAFVETRGAGGVGVSAFAGAPVVRRFSNYSRGDLASGGRLSWAPTYNFQTGIGLSQIVERAATVRQDLGADLRWHLAPRWTLVGAALWSIPESRFAEFDGLVRWQPLSRVEISGGYRRTAPDLFLPRNSILSVFAETTRDDVGATVTASPAAWIVLTADGRALWLNTQQGYDASLRASFRPLEGDDTTLTAQVRRLAVPVNGYTQGRISGRHRLPAGVGLSAELDYYRLDAAIRGQLNSLSWSASATYNLAPEWFLGLGLVGGSTPFFERNTEVMARLSYAIPEARR